VKDSYTVKEIRLLSSILLNSDGALVQAPNTVLNTMFIQNIRRSPQMSETFTFDVDFGTTFKQLETLRDKMIDFLQAERRDYQPVFDVVVVDFPEQAKMVLTANIQYKSHWQQDGIRASRRNKWICALKTTLADLKIFGPTGDPKAKPATKPCTIVLKEFREDEHKDVRVTQDQPIEPVGGWRLSDRNAVIVPLEDTRHLFDNGKEIPFSNPHDAQQPKLTTAVPTPHHQPNPEFIEMSRRP